MLELTALVDLKWSQTGPELAPFRALPPTPPQACALPTPQLQKRLFSEASEDGQEAAADGAEGGQEQ